MCKQNANNYYHNYNICSLNFAVPVNTLNIHTSTTCLSLRSKRSINDLKGISPTAFYRAMSILNLPQMTSNKQSKIGKMADFGIFVSKNE